MGNFDYLLILLLVCLYLRAKLSSSSQILLDKHRVKLIKELMIFRQFGSNDYQRTLIEGRGHSIRKADLYN
jgi:hypothetical protein